MPPKRGTARTIRKTLYVEESSDEGELEDGPNFTSDGGDPHHGPNDKQQKKADLTSSSPDVAQDVVRDAQSNGSRQGSATVARVARQRTARNEKLERALGFVDDDTTNDNNNNGIRSTANAQAVESVELSFTPAGQQATPPQHRARQRPQQHRSSSSQLELESTFTSADNCHSSREAPKKQFPGDPSREGRHPTPDSSQSTPKTTRRKRKRRAQREQTPPDTPDLQALNDIMSFIPTNQTRYMRACMVCSIVRTEQQFKTSGCPNCESFLELANNGEAIQECTSGVFDGLMTIADTSKSWVARYQRLEGYVPGVYAAQVEGVLPEEVIVAAENAGINYIPRDGSVSEALPVDG